MLPSEQQHWALSDLALAAFRAGDRRTCLWALGRSAGVSQPPVEEKLKAALEHNRAACTAELPPSIELPRGSALPPASPSAKVK